MENTNKNQNKELIPLLIKYKECFGVIFPITLVKHLSNEIVVERIKKCISENKLYEPNLANINEKQLLLDKDLKQIIPSILSTMDSINYDYKPNIKEILDIIEKREKGKVFSFSEHLEALIIALLSNHRWGDSNIRNNRLKIKEIFHNFDKNYLKVIEPKILISELKKIHCTNPRIKQQLGNLSYNIQVLEKIEKKYKTLDNFVNSIRPNDIANLFNDGKNKMKEVGRSFAFDYLKRVRINTCKSTNPIERLFGANRLAIVKNETATEKEVLSIIKKMSLISSFSEIEIESILQQFCLLRSANICGEHPKCEKCKLRDLCKYDK